MKYTGRIGGVLFVFINSVLNLKLSDQPLLGTQQILFSVANLALCWWLGKKYDEAKFYSEKDPLSQVYNRRFVMKLFSKLLAKVNRKNEKLTLFVLDIDNFKEINDTFGHEIGDSVITEIAKGLTMLTRKTDVVARWGGDEFIVIMPYSDEANPDLLVERINHHLEDVSQKLGMTITISIGQSAYPDNAKNLVDLIRIADKRMYERKFGKKSSSTYTLNYEEGMKE
jgi:diguanylate cyclase (GGDEF)-like protein